MDSLKKKNGITLIALVVTIVVLWSLAAVSISMLTGENGIIRKCTKSKNKKWRKWDNRKSSNCI